MVAEDQPETSRAGGPVGRGMTGSADGSRRPRRLSRWRARIRRRRVLDVGWRVGVFVVGALFVLGGLVMLVTPGPGWVAIIVGLAVLATEYAWADGLLRWARERARAAGEKARGPRLRRTLLVAGVIAAVLVGSAVTWVLLAGWPQPVDPAVEWLRDLT